MEQNININEHGNYLNKIKDLLDDGCFDTCTGPYSVSRDSVKEVWKIVEQMAIVIENKNKETYELKNFLSVVKDQCAELTDGNERLRANQPVACDKCEHQNKCYKTISISTKMNAAKYLCHRTENLKFCSAAIKKGENNGN